MKKMLALLLSLAVCQAGAFTMDDIHFWVGEGTNRMAVVIDWTYMGFGAKAWGYRWNGENKKSLFDILSEIRKEDHRLTFSYEDGPYGPYLTFMGYDEKDSCPVWDFQNGVSTDPNSWFGLEDSTFYSYGWRIFGGPTSVYCPEKGKITLKGETFPTMPQYQSEKGIGGLIPSTNEWYVLTFGEYPEWIGDWTTGYSEAITLETPVAAESPYGWRVHGKNLEVQNPIFGNPDSVLGRPSTFNQDRPGMPNPGDLLSGGLGTYNSPGPVNPAHPPLDFNSILSIENPGSYEAPYIEIEFDHRVYDDEKNPYGLDFIVFGNAFAEKNNKIDYTQNDNPEDIRFTGKGISDLGAVSVSQDGEHWVEIENRFCEDPVPTLGFVYDPDHPDTDLYPGNLYWGEKTDATLPMDPSIKWTDFAKYNLAQWAKIYGKSAGGTGFDINALDLPKDDSNRKWIKFVRIKSIEGSTEEGDVGWTQPEVDAVADVRPVDGYSRWVIQNYTWENRWNPQIAGREALGKNGKKNVVSYLMGYPANVSCPLDFKVSKFIPGKNFHILEFKTKEPITQDLGIFVDFFKDIRADVWKREMPYYEQGYRSADGFFVNRAKVSNPIMDNPDQKQLFMKLVFPE